MKLDTTSRPHSVREWSIIGCIVGTLRRKDDDRVLCVQISEVADKWMLVSLVTGGGDLAVIVNETQKRLQGEYDSLADAIKAADAFFDEWME